MGTRSSRIPTAAAAACLLALCGAAARAAAPALNVTASYTVAGAEDGGEGVALSFAAELFNQADAPVTGEAVLRDPADSDRVFARFGSVTIAPRGSVRVSADDVQIPGAIYRSWSKGGAPGLYLDVENAEGDVTLFRVPVTRAVAR